MYHRQSMPASMLASPHLLSPGLTIVTGSRGVGKSLWCSSLVSYAMESGYTVGGILCPPQIQDDIKTGIWLADIHSGEQRLLSSRSESQHHTVPVGRGWYFDQEVMQWGNDLLKTSFDRDVIAIDEIGPLELLDGEGFQAGVQLLDQKQYRSAFVVIRLSLLPDAVSRWSPERVYDIVSGNP